MSNWIVCGVDLSPGSTRVAAAAARLARNLGCQAVLAHADREPPGLASLGRARRLRDLKALAAELPFPGRTDVRIAAGDPVDALVELAAKHDAELIVVGSRGRRDGLSGRVSAALMRSAPCRVVLVPPNAVSATAAPGRGGSRSA